MYPRIGFFARRNVAHDRQNLAAGIRQIAAFEVANRGVLPSIENSNAAASPRSAELRQSMACPRLGVGSRSNSD